MINRKTTLAALALMCAMGMQAQKHTVSSPDQQLVVDVELTGGKATYSVKYAGKEMIEASPLGLRANIGDYSQGLSFVEEKTAVIDRHYTLDRSKQSQVDYKANALTLTLQNSRKQKMDVEFRVSDHDIAFRYMVHHPEETGSLRVMEETTGFDFPAQTTTFLCPQSDAMIGWKRTKPSYEEEYKLDAPMSARSQYGHGFTFPCLFKVGEDGWVLVSETGLDSHYCGSHLSDATAGGLYTIAFPMAEENNGNGSVEPAFALPGHTPWRTITVGSTLKPIVETTIPWDNLEPLYEPSIDYKYGRGTWSWIVWQDNSINYDDQVKYIDLAAAMGYDFVLIDNWWDTNIGKEGMERLAQYAHSKGVSPFVWYSSSGYWNDIVQGPINRMDNPIVRKKEMKWLKSIGAKGIKVDFFGGDKQETIRLYEQILSDANDYGLMVIFHGCTLPRGWEVLYPNYVGSEAVLASENIYFSQHFCDEEAVNTSTHPFIRNAVGCMEYGGCFMNRRMSRDNKRGNTRKTTDAFQLATTVLFQNPIQNFALTPNNLDDAPAICMDYLRQVPTTWDETQFIDGYPGKSVVMARRHGEKWYVAGVTASKTAQTFELSLPMFSKGDVVTVYSDGKDREPEMKQVKISNPKKVKITAQGDGGFVIVK
jgi:hypothetical protein